MKSKKIIKITLEHSPFSYRIVDEHLRLKTMAHPNFPLNQGHLYIAKNSQYINWLANNLGYFVKSLNLMHFLICDQDKIMDIIDTDEPRIEVLSNLDVKGKSE